MRLYKSIQKDFDSLKLIEGKYLVAFSGGPDSVFLLWMLKEYYQDKLNKHISLVYINYHDSPYVDEEEKIVYYYKKLFSLDLFKYDVKFDGKGNFEEWARDYRYHLFDSLCIENKFSALLTAHQKTDVVETYLLQKARHNLPTYFGLRKKSSIYSTSLLRPMLSISKQQLIKQLNKNNVPYYDDITNKNLSKKRNFIRTTLSSEKELNQYIIKINQENRRLKAIYSKFDHYPLEMKYSQFENDETLRRYCFYLLDKFNIKNYREGLGKRMYDFIHKHCPDKMELNNKYCLYKTNEYFFIAKNTASMNYSFIFNEKNEYKTSYFKINLSNLNKFNLPALPVEIRNFHSGDQISTNLPEKDVYKFLKKQGVPYYLIPIYPVFIYQNKIQCVPFYKDILNKKIPFSFVPITKL